MQYRFAKCSDVLMMLVGVVGAVVAGAGLPLHALIFGQVISRFVYYSIAEPIYGKHPFVESFVNAQPANMNKSYFCEDKSDYSLLNQYLNSSDIKVELGSIISIFSYYYVGLATAVMIGAFVANLTLNTSAYRQIRRMRIAFYNSVLRQEVGWFDVTKTGQLNTRLQE